MNDTFSNIADQYAQYRPTYPQAIFDHILQFVPGKDNAWDCGTGNGQAAISLSKLFKTVYATDTSERQILHAIKKDNIIYSVQPAEHTQFDNNIFDLVLIAQAIHWFGFDAFYREVKRTARKKAVIAVIGYGLVQTDLDMQKIIDNFYYNIVGPYWDKERSYIDENYKTIPFPFIELPVIELFHEVKWNISALCGYINTWSAVQHFILAKGYNPVELLTREILKAWPPGELASFRFPILQRIGRLD